MNQGLIPGRYAKALLKFAQENKTDEIVYNLMGKLVQSFLSNPQLQQAVTNPFVSDADKEKLLRTAAGAGTNDATFNDFLQLLSQNRRLDLSRDIALAYIELYRKANNIYEVTLTSAAPMDEDERKRLLSIISSHLNGGKMELDSRIDPELIGGFTVKINNEKLDASIANELKQLRLKLLSK